MIKRKTRQGIFALSVLTIASWYLSQDPSSPGREPLSRIDTRLNYVLQDFGGHLLDQQGNVSMEISSPMLRKSAESEVGTIESPVIQIQQENEQWYIMAESAIITADREIVSLIGDVNMRRINKESGETLEITTRDVMLNITPRTASTESLVTLVQSGDRLDAIGMNLNLINNNYELLEEVRAHYDLP